MVPIDNGWEVKCDKLVEGLSTPYLVPVWFEGDPLPSDEEYDSHIKQKFHVQRRTDDIEVDKNNESDTESDCDTDEYPESEPESSDEDDDEDDM